MVDDVVNWARHVDQLLRTLEEVLARLVNRGLFVAVSFEDKMKLCGRLHSGKITRPDPDRIQESMELRRLETSREPLQFIRAVERRWFAIPTLVELEVLSLVIRLIPGTDRERVPEQGITKRPL